MKKIINITLILLILVYLISLSLPSLNKIYFLIKHISLYISLSIITYKLIEYYYNKLIKKTDKSLLLTIIHVMKIVIFAFVLIVIAMFQTDYINRKEKLYVRGCQYYDQYDHLIYQSYYSGDCPKLENYSLNNNSLKFTVHESKSGHYGYHVINHMIIPNGFDEQSNLDFKSITDVEIQYDDYNRMSNVILKTSELVKINKNGTVSYAYNSFIRKINNDYDSDSFESMIEYGEFHDFNYQPLNQSEVSHYEFKDTELLTTRLYQVVESKSNTQKIIRIYKDRHLNGEIETELLAESIVNMNLDSSNLYEIETDIKVTHFSGIQSSTILSIFKDHIEFDLYEKVSGSTININRSSWKNIRNFENIILKKRSELTSRDGELINDYKRFYDPTRKSVMLEGISIYELKHTAYGKRITSYRRSNLSIFDSLEGRKISPLSHYYDLLYKPNHLFDDEYNLTQTKTTGDIIYQKVPFFFPYYNH